MEVRLLLILVEDHKYHVKTKISLSRAKLFPKSMSSGIIMFWTFRKHLANFPPQLFHYKRLEKLG